MQWRWLVCAAAVWAVACGDESGGDTGADAGGDAAPSGPVIVEPLTVDGSGCAACDGACAEESLTYATRTHQTREIEYRNTPPAGGDHDGCWGQWGVQAEALDARHWVHNMEHGGVVFLYNCPDGCAAEVTELTAYVESLGNRAILTAYPELGTRFGAVAWGHRLLTDCLDMDAMRDFYDRRANQGPESVSSGPPSGCM